MVLRCWRETPDLKTWRTNSSIALYLLLQSEGSGSKNVNDFVWSIRVQNPKSNRRNYDQYVADMEAGPSSCNPPLPFLLQAGRSGNSTGEYFQPLLDQRYLHLIGLRPYHWHLPLCRVMDLKFVPIQVIT